jgi:hypothetical protein
MADATKIAALEREAFGFGSVQARGELFRMIGGDDADARAQAWGLRNLQDYKTKGVQPGTAYEPDPNRPDPSRVHDREVMDTKKGKNPWSAETWDPVKQQSIVRSLGVAIAASLAKSAVPPAFIGSPRPGAVNLTSFGRAS